ncbi:MAG: hypothetical protein H6766_01185 [Candidatus Peribacteria bacterium]|nr:MAG: hypothetical protein H6766_01185 [Candidatus Peribacteria bacterium]
MDCDNDGVFEQTGLTRDATCTYATPGLHTVRITGQFPHFYLFNDDYSRLHLQPNHSDNYLIPNEHPFMD